MKHLKYAHSFEVVAELPEPLRPLKKLAYNLWWSWNHAAREVFREVDRNLWEEVEHNPVELINRLGKDRQARLMDDPLFLAKLKMCESELDAYMARETWFDRKCPDQKGKLRIAYFCAEFGVHECLPIYSGGLGVLAGDHLKAASDLGLPLLGVGLLYSRGYFRQQLTPDGWQQERYPDYDFYKLPLQLVRGADDQPLRVDIDLPDRHVTCQVWLAQVGRVPLYLLDSNVLENEPTDQGITDTLYGGDEEMRLRQEIILGVGGVRALAALGIEPTVCHMNEGHAAFLSLERLRQFVKRTGADVKLARQVIVSGNVFTTHTPVPAGFDLFQASMLERYVSKTVQDAGLTLKDFLAMGKVDDDNEGEAFNMAVLAMENANHVNGVSRLHAKVSRGMFQSRWPDFPVEEVPIDAITNGVHTMSWLSRRMAELLDRHLGPAWREDPADPEVWRQAAEIPEVDLWEMRENQRGDFVRFCRRRLQRELARRTGGRANAATANNVLDPRILTVGFARRFATYKRASLLFSDPDRLKALLFHPERPVQFVFAGKSHPRDDGGKKIIQDIVRFIESEGKGRMVFLADYDMQVARALVQGVDVWLNNPRRPMEASGTSGMKAVPNGVLNCSVLDGWWAEAFKPGVGWAIGDEAEYADQGYQDWLDSRALYQTLETEVAPRFYHRGDSGIPSGWIEWMKASMRELAPRYSTSRMVREYACRFYVPASDSFLTLQENGMALANEALAWRKRVRAAWPSVKVLKVVDDGATKMGLGSKFKVTAEVALGDLAPGDVRVQAVVGQVGPNREIHHMDLVDLVHTGFAEGRHTYMGEVTCDRPGHRGYLVRIVPHHEHVQVQSELGLARWEA